MINSGVTYQAGLARITDLRGQADKHRWASIAGLDPDASGLNRRQVQREQLRRALATLRPGRIARA